MSFPGTESGSAASSWCHAVARFFRDTNPAPAQAGDWPRLSELDVADEVRDHCHSLRDALAYFAGSADELRGWLAAAAAAAESARPDDPPAWASSEETLRWALTLRLRTASLTAGPTAYLAAATELIAGAERAWHGAQGRRRPRAEVAWSGTAREVSASAA